MSTTLHREGIVGPDGKIEITLPELQPGQKVSITIQLEHALPQTPHPAGQRYTARELLALPREEREHILLAAAEAAEAEYRENHALSDFEAFGEKDLYDEHPE